MRWFALSPSPRSTSILLLLPMLLTVSCKSGQMEMVLPDQSLPETRRTLPATSSDVTTHPIEINLEEGKVTIDLEGRITTVYRRIFTVKTPAGANDWGTFSANYAPWFENQPSFTAKVTYPDGSVKIFDPSTTQEGPLQQRDAEMLTDRRYAAAPLPRLEVGALVEETVTLSEHRPFFGRSALNSFDLYADFPTRLNRLIVEVPDPLQLSYKVFNIPLEPTVTREGSVTRYTIEQHDLTPRDDIEILTPPEQAIPPHIAYALTGSWAEQAKSYTELATKALTSGGIEELTRDLKLAPNASPRATISAVVERLHEKVRYTGLEFGESAIIPHDPAETLSRGYGDCKDKASLLVAALTSLGIEARLALLKAGYGRDVVEELPALNQFNHVIVYVPGPDPIWIDATVPYARLNQLPLADQGRHALIIDKETTGLTLIPKEGASSNRLEQTITFTLSPDASASIVEETRYFGELELDWRSDYADSSYDNARQGIDGYVSEIYGVEEADDLKITEATDLSSPFRIKVSMSRKAPLNSFEGSMSIDITVGDLFSPLPKLFLEEVDEKAPNYKARKADLRLPMPFRTSVTWRIVSPDGFRPAPPPEKVSIASGPLSAEVSFNVSEDHVLEANLWLEVTDAPFTKEMLKEAREKLLKLSGLFPIEMIFEESGKTKLDAGKYAEAFSEYRELIKKHADQAWYHQRYARALLEAGFGEAARREAELAVKLAPQEAGPHLALGWVLEHDLLGRRYGEGSDRAGALAAYRRAKALAPNRLEVELSLAALLEVGAEGQAWGGGADLKEAISIYDFLLRSWQAQALSDNLVKALYYDGQYDRARVVAQQLDSVPALAVFIASETLLSGGASAIKKLNHWVENPQEREAGVSGARYLLFSKRLYGPLADLLSHVTLPKDPKRDSLIVTLKQLDANSRRKITDKTPADLARMFVYRLSDRKGALEALCAISVPALCESLKKDPSQVDSLHQSLLSNKDLSPDIMADFLAMRDPRLEGDEKTGYRVSLLSMDSSEDTVVPLFIVKEKGAYKIASIWMDSSRLAEQARRCLDEKNLAGAATWLSWAREYRNALPADDPFGNDFYPVLWSATGTPTETQIRLGIAALEAHEGTPQAIAELEKAHSTTTDPSQSVQISRALIGAYNAAKRFEDMLLLADELHASHPENTFPVAIRANGLYELKRYAEAVSALREAQALDPDNWALVDQEAHALARMNDLKGGYEVMRRFADRDQNVGGLMNNLAWSGLFLFPTDPILLEDALQSVTLDGGTDSSFHTLAAIYAEQGDVRQAKDTLFKVIDARLGKVESVDYYIVGRMAEACGLPEEARVAYAKVEKSEDDPLSTFLLVERRLKLLEAPETEKK